MICRSQRASVTTSCCCGRAVWWPRAHRNPFWKPVTCVRPTVSRPASIRSTASLLCMLRTTCHDAVAPRGHTLRRRLTWAARPRMFFRRAQSSILRWKAGARTARSRGACWIACWKTTASTSADQRDQRWRRQRRRRCLGSGSRRSGRRARASARRMGSGSEGRGARTRPSLSYARGLRAFRTPWLRWRPCSRPMTSTRWASIPSASSSKPRSISISFARRRAQSC